MIRPKFHLYNIYRTPPDKLDRLKFLRLDKNEDTIGLPEEVIQEILSEVTPDFISTYPLTYRLYESLSEFLSLSEDHLLITAGSDAAIKAAFEGFVEPGDEVIIPDPTFAMFEVYADLFRGEMKKITYKSDLSLSIEEMFGSITQKTKLIGLPNPNSPTGTIVRREDILNLLKHAEAVGAVVLIDEAYYPFYPNSVIDFVKEYQNLIVTRTFSKAFGLASVRLGFAAAHPETIKILSKFKPIYEVNSFAVLFGCAALKHPEWMEQRVQEVLKGRRYLESEMNRLGLKTYPTYTNFMHIEVGESNVEPLVEHMRKFGILIRSGFTHDTLRQCIRITLGPESQMRYVAQKIEEYMKKRHR